MKTCTGCHIEKPENDFRYVPSKRRREARCKVCRKAVMRAWRLAHPERMKAIRKRSQAKLAEQAEAGMTCGECERPIWARGAWS